MKIAGSCHCQAVKYSVESDGPYPYQKCYCTICRKTSGGEGYSINLSADADTLQVEGKQHLQTYQAMVTQEGKTAEKRASPAVLRALRQPPVGLAQDLA
ncbi:MAG: hypothetical protein Ct9H300mP16_13060 [Pseudomonadota bacterium]|nr:MAG: hypothetical protein Ct9H300mP16_13060 [Pseudomonadota bacterium]